MEELCDLSHFAVDVIMLLINRLERLSKSWRGPFRKVVLAFYNFKCLHKCGPRISTQCSNAFPTRMASSILI